MTSPAPSARWADRTPSTLPAVHGAVLLAGGLLLHLLSVWFEPAVTRDLRPYSIGWYAVTAAIRIPGAALATLVITRRSIREWPYRHPWLAALLMVTILIAISRAAHWWTMRAEGVT